MDIHSATWLAEPMVLWSACWMASTMAELMGSLMVHLMVLSWACSTVQQLVGAKAHLSASSLVLRLAVRSEPSMVSTMVVSKEHCSVRCLVSHLELNAAFRSALTKAHSMADQTVGQTDSPTAMSMAG